MRSTDQVLAASRGPNGAETSEGDLFSQRGAPGRRGPQWEHVAAHTEPWSKKEGPTPKGMGPTKAPTPSGVGAVYVLAATYSPTRLPQQYHPRCRA
jgi:hypothetical protein